MRFSLASFLAAAIASALVLSGCRVPPAGEMLVQRVNPSTQRALVFAEAGIGSGAAHVRVRNVGEPGSSLRFDVDVPPGMASSVARATLGAGEAIDLVFGANAPSRDTTVTIRANDAGIEVPVRVVADDGLICAPSLPAGLASSVPGGGSGSAPLGGAHTAGIEVVVTYAAEPIRAAASPALARRQVADWALASASASLLRPGGVGEHDLAVVPDAAALERLRRTPGVALVAPNVPVYRTALPNDTFIDEQWWLAPFGVTAGWAVQAGAGPGDDVIVAIVDDGVNTAHRDLRGKIVPGCDVFDFDGDVRAMSDHGSHVAGLAAATGDNDFGIAGIGYGPAVRILPVKIFPDDPAGSGTLDSVLRGLRWSAGLSVAGLGTNHHPADVINMSFGFGRSPGTWVVGVLAATVEEIVDAGAQHRPVLIAASGNQKQRGLEDPGAGVEYPARLDGVIAVGAVDEDGLRSAFSFHGDGLDVVAPGGSGSSSACGATGPMLSTGSDSEAAFVCLMGTSMATPIVSGAVALLLLETPDLRNDPEGVTAHLAATAWRAPWIGPDSANEYGAGIVCLDAVLGTGTTCGAAGP